MQNVEKGEWEARVLIKDKKNSKSYLVNVDFSAEKPAKLRMDVTTPLGIHVTSFALNDKAASYVIPQKKVYYNGPAGANVFKPVMNLNLDPKILINVLFDIPFKGAGWNCQNEKDALAVCEKAAEQFKVTWSDRHGKEKTVLITHREFELQIKFHAFKAKSEFKDEFFEIKQPEGFRKI